MKIKGDCAYNLLRPYLVIISSADVGYYYSVNSTSALMRTSLRSWDIAYLRKNLSKSFQDLLVSLLVEQLNLDIQESSTILFK